MDPQAALMGWPRYSGRYGREVRMDPQAASLRWPHYSGRYGGEVRTDPQAASLRWPHYSGRYGGEVRTDPQAASLRWPRYSGRHGGEVRTDPQAASLRWPRYSGRHGGEGAESFYLSLAEKYKKPDQGCLVGLGWHYLERRLDSAGAAICFLVLLGEPQNSAFDALEAILADVLTEFFVIRGAIAATV